MEMGNGALKVSRLMRSNPVTNSIVRIYRDLQPYIVYKKDSVYLDINFTEKITSGHSSYITMISWTPPASLGS